ncbi:MAG: TonB family protein [Acidobacteriota bacterium]
MPGQGARWSSTGTHAGKTTAGAESGTDRPPARQREERIASKSDDDTELFTGAVWTRSTLRRLQDERGGRTRATRQEKFLLISVLVHAILFAAILQMRPRAVPEPQKGALVLHLKRPAPEVKPREPLPPLRFQKPGPRTDRNQAGLPPAPPSSATPSDMPGGQPPPPPPPPKSTEAQKDRESPLAPGERLVAPSGRGDRPFSSSLDNLGKYLPQGSGRGTGPGTTSSRLLSGDASFAFDSGGFDLSEWAELVKLKVKSNWVIPTAAYMGMKGIVAIELVIEKDGSISFSEVQRSSDIISMDSAALNAIRSSHPLPPLPKGFPRANLPARFTFYYNLYPED